MIDKKVFAAYNKTRYILVDKTICHAPFTSINFEQSGNATACCYNRSHVLGTFPKNTIREMWYGENANRLRAYILNNELGGGCQLCLKQLYSHNFSNCKAKGYDFYADSWVKSSIQKIVYRKKIIEYPKVMEFELSNTCNLECVMCSGHFSSSIRKNREMKSPLTSPYNDEFVSQLEEFVPYLKEARFLGGEPFLIDIYYQIWEMILRVNPQLKISITTNGSVLNNKNKELLNKLNCGIIISVDSIVKETYEKIRINAKHETLMKNFEWLYNYSQTKRMGMSFAVCPMTENCHEMPELVDFCNNKGIEIYFNTVLQPQEYSIRSYDSEKLFSVYNLYSTYSFKTTDKISIENIKHFIDLTHQIKAWYDEKVKIENNRKIYSERVNNFKIKFEKEDELNDCRSKILKLIISLEQYEGLQSDEEFPLNYYFFDPEYVDTVQKHPQEHFSLLTEEFGFKNFFISYIDVLLVIASDRLSGSDREKVSEQINGMYQLADDPLLKRIVKGIIMKLPSNLIQLIKEGPQNELRNRIIALFRPEDELIDYSEKSISEFVEDVLKRIRLYFERNTVITENEKKRKTENYKMILNNVLKKMPSDISNARLKRQLFLPPVIEIIKSIDRMSEEMIYDWLINLSKS